MTRLPPVDVTPNLTISFHDDPPKVRWSPRKTTRIEVLGEIARAIWLAQARIAELERAMRAVEAQPNEPKDGGQ